MDSTSDSSSDEKQDVDALLEQLNSARAGLSSADAEARLVQLAAMRWRRRQNVSWGVCWAISGGRSPG